MPHSLRIALYTIRDQMRFRSFYILLALCIVFLFIIRGCYNSNYEVNGKQVDTVTLAWQASMITFHVIAAGALLIALMLGMRMFGRDREDGSLVLFMSRPVNRTVYLLGRVGGVWLLSFAFMFILHLTVFAIAYMNTKAIIPGYLTASLVCGLNILFCLGLVCLLSFHVPEFMAAIISLAVIGIGFASDTFTAIMQSTTLQNMGALPTVQSAPALWRVLWPKTMALQYWATSLISHDAYRGIGPLHPSVNILCYTAICLTLLVLTFRRKEL
jgi:ABC-type transport system involved in multi-copper enzyme maturation permease subunit